MSKIILTADETLMTEYGGASFLGFVLCAPRRFLPNALVRYVICPKPKMNGNTVIAPPYALRKVEATLVNYGFSRNNIIMAHPSRLKKAVSRDTKVVGINAVDPMGRGPVSWTLRHLLGGGKPVTQVAFEILMKKIKALKNKYGFKVILGGPGAWQVTDKEAKYFGIDVRFHGEAERTLPQIIHKLINGEEIPKKEVFGESPSLNEIYPILGPQRCGFVEITRGCGRNCQFCAPTQKLWKSIPIPIIEKEARLSALNGDEVINLLSEDWLRYGAKGFKELNKNALIKLLKTIKNIPRVKKIVSTHVNFSTVKVAGEEFINELNEIMGINEKEPWVGPQIGLETGSPRLIAKYMKGKVLPWTPKEYHELVIEAVQILKDVHWYPCITLITGLPGETESDILITLELLDEMKDARAWFFPLFFIPIGDSRLSKEKFFQLYLMNESRWELLMECWKRSAIFALKFIRHVTSGAENSFIKIFLNKLFNRLSIESLKFIDKVKNNPSMMLEELSKINLNRPGKFLLKTFVSIVAK
ncbi:MAG: B12-binding domain-containing radical SAM protein [Candidatus Odinarchaeia archaeon]